MNKEEFIEIVKKFNNDKVFNNWSNLLDAGGNCGWEKFKEKIINYPDYYSFKNAAEFKFWLNNSEKEDFVEKRFCPICGEFISTVIRKPYQYPSACCKEHIEKFKAIHRQKTNLQKYGTKTPAENKVIANKVKTSWNNKTDEELSKHINKIRNSKLEKYGNENYNNIEKIKQTNLKKYGVEFGLACAKIRNKNKKFIEKKQINKQKFTRTEIMEKVKKTNLERYGVEYPLQSKEIHTKTLITGKLRGSYKKAVKKSKLTKFERYGDENYNNTKKIIETRNTFTTERLVQIENTRKNTCLQRYGNENYNNIEKIKQTCLKKYGVINPSYNEDIKKKIAIRAINSRIKNHTTVAELMQSTKLLSNGLTYKENFITKVLETKRKNGTLNTSPRFENMLIEYLRNTYPEYTIITQYNKDPRYPYMCDCYIKELDLFIEFQGSYFHNYRPFQNIEEHIKEYKEMIVKGGQKATIANVWRYKDVEKRELAKKNNINYLEYWENLLILPEDIETQYTKILYYHQKLFYEQNRKELFDPIVRWKYYLNAKKHSDFYKNHGYVSHLCLLKRPYISKQLGYSSFNISLCKNISKNKIVYDPCGGWGHRMLGFKKHKGYIYNDICTETYQINKVLANNENITNVTFYNQDANLPIKDEYDIVFTCPPYYNKEIFSGSGAENLSEEDFQKWWNTVMLNLHPKDKLVYIVINSNYLKYFTANNYKYNIISTTLRKSHFHKQSKTSEELLVCFYI